MINVLNEFGVCNLFQLQNPNYIVLAQMLLVAVIIFLFFGFSRPVKIPEEIFTIFLFIDRKNETEKIRIQLIRIFFYTAFFYSFTNFLLSNIC